LSLGGIWIKCDRLLEWSLVRVGSHVDDRWCCCHVRSSECCVGSKVQVMVVSELGHVRASGVIERVANHLYPFISVPCGYVYFCKSRKKINYLDGNLYCILLAIG
jgi:hypothetical protein